MLNLSNMRLGKRLTVGFGAIMAAVGVVAALVMLGSASVNGSNDEALKQYRKMRLALEVGWDVDNVYLNIWSTLGTASPADQARFKEEIGALRDSYKKKIEELSRNAVTPTGKKLLEELGGALGGAREINNNALDLAARGKNAEAQSLYATEGNVRRLKVHEAIQKLVEWREARISSAERDAAGAKAAMVWKIFGGGLFVALATILIGIFIVRSVARPIGVGVGLLGKISTGDLTCEVSPDLRGRKDEAGDLGRAMQAMTENLRSMVQEMNGGVSAMAFASQSLASIAESTLASVKDMSSRTSTVAAAAEESSANTTSVASSMEEASSSLASVATATEEMSATVGEIAANSEKARAISEEATAQAESISAMMQQLGLAAQEIGKVTETITDISSQTNLLALNATIEAARAGAAGKGFAVVANEIKELARQTATATEDIKAKIAGVQNSAGGAIADIEKIAGVIKEVSSIVSSIAAAIEEQATVTRDVAGNIAQASAGVKDANERVSQTASVSKSIAQDIAGITTGVDSIAEGGKQVQESSSDLSQLGEQLKNIVGRFKA
jgi:methyl-accepting chemotaxis protein